MVLIENYFPNFATETRQAAIVEVRAVHAPEGDFRNWQAIDAFAGDIADHLKPNP